LGNTPVREPSSNPLADTRGSSRSTHRTPPIRGYNARMVSARTATRVLLAGFLAALPLVTGCVERTITITSEPSGSLVYLNDEEVGRTPVTVPFRFYGVYDVRLEHDGYAPLWTKHQAHQPWWDFMGPDLIAETIPHAKSQQTWSFSLAPRPADDPDLLMAHARQMRSATNQTQPGDASPAGK
jgi:hypothetical protein